MTLRHVLTITAALVLFAAVGVVITVAVRRLLDWQAQRNYTPPPLFTEVWPRQLASLAFEDGGDTVPLVVPPVRVPAWVMKAAPVEENLAEFAKRVPDAPALIGCALEAKYELRRLAVSAA